MANHQPAQVCTDEQIIEALRLASSQNAAAKTLGIHIRTLQRRIPLLAKRGFSPQHDMTKTVPDGYLVKGTSTLYGEDGQQKLQWVKSSVDAERQHALMLAVVAAMCEDIKRAKPVAPPKSVLADLCNQYTITDYHLGMLSWHEETGADWDTDIAEKMLLDWFTTAIALSPNAKVGIFAQLGDLLHWDGMDAVTPASKHLLDADTRFQRLVRVVIRVLRQVIAMLLAKHELVHIIQAEGNHDPASSIWLRELMAALYENEPRITVDVSPDPYYGYEWGDTLLLYHHGHKRKPEGLDAVFVAKFKEAFGRSKNVYAHTGHMHHAFLKETSLMIVEQHRTLAAPDAYASRGGWMSGRDAQVITYHRQFGEVGRVRVSSSMLQAA